MGELVRLAKAALKQQRGVEHAMKASTVPAGSPITWTRGDLTVQHGTVDFVHVDAEGQTWAFVTLADRTWAAVNLRYITHPPVSPDAMAGQSEGT
jgi:hypothetical protein